MATSGKFEVITSAWNAMKPSEIGLIDTGAEYQVRVAHFNGSSGRSTLSLSMNIPRVDTYTVFDAIELPSVEFAVLTDGYVTYFQPLSGALNFWIAEGSLAVNGMFQIKMTPKNAGDWPQELTVDGFFSLANT